jgi:hypothetical protein
MPVLPRAEYIPRLVLGYGAAESNPERAGNRLRMLRPGCLKRAQLREVDYQRRRVRESRSVQAKDRDCGFGHHSGIDGWHRVGVSLPERR